MMMNYDELMDFGGKKKVYKTLDLTGQLEALEALQSLNRSLSLP